MFRSGSSLSRFALFGYSVDAVVANRLLPEAVTDPWFKAWKETHAEHLTTIEEGFAPVPVLKAELAAEELVGVDRQTDLAVIKIERTGLPHLSFGDPKDVHVGQVVMAFGSPFGYVGSEKLAARKV